jgi:hypothetical protein
MPNDPIAAQCAAALAFNLALAARSKPRPPPGQPLEPMKVPGAPPGDARYAGPPKAPAMVPWWRRKML